MTYYITTPIYYVNAQPHLGHAYTTIATDVLARHMRQRGEDVFFLTGTDEHGEPVADARTRRGSSPRSWPTATPSASRRSGRIWTCPTTSSSAPRTPSTSVKVQEVLQRVHDNGHTYKGLYEGWYCPRCADFKVENEILEGNRCPIHEIPLDARAGGELVLPPVDLPGAARAAVRRSARLRDAPARYNEALSFITSGLQDVSLSRARLQLGRDGARGTRACVLRLVRRAAQLLHGLDYASPGEDLAERFWPATYHIIGKDILKFHTVYWPALLMAAELPLPTTCSSTASCSAPTGAR